MTETKQEITPAITPDPTDLLLAEAEVREKDPKKPHHKPTAGETAFNRTVYTGIGFGVNEVSAILIADEFQHRSGKKLFESISEWMVKTFKYTDTIKNGVTMPANKNAASMLMWASLLISGTLLVYPMKKLEDHKSYWVKKANHFFDWMQGTKMAPEEVEKRDTEVEQAIACEAKQTWPSLLIGRGIAMLTAIGLGKLIGASGSEKMMNASERFFTGSVQAEGMKNRWHSYLGVLPLETLSCATTSIALEISSKLFAKRWVKVRNPELCTAVVHDQLPASATDTKADAQNDDEAKQAAPCAPCALNAYKKKPIVKMDNHVDAAKASETSYSLGA